MSVTQLWKGASQPAEEWRRKKRRRRELDAADGEGGVGGGGHEAVHAQVESAESEPRRGGRKKEPARRCQDIFRAFSSSSSELKTKWQRLSVFEIVASVHKKMTVKVELIREGGGQLKYHAVLFDFYTSVQRRSGCCSICAGFSSIK